MKPTLALDLDGTLVSCAARHCALMRQLCRGDGLPDDFIARVWAAKREGASNLRALVALGHPQAPARAAAWAREIERWPWLGFDRLLPGVVEALSTRRHRVLVLTARRERYFLQQQLDRLGLTPLIDRLIVVPPAEAAFAKAQALLEHRPVAFVGDAESDAEAAAAAAIPFLALSCGMRSAAFWQGRNQPAFADLSGALQALPP